MSAPSLEDGIEAAGSPVALLWKPDAAPWMPEVVEREYAGWRAEQQAWHSAATISDLSHHMYDMSIEGPDALRLLSDTGANSFTNFAVGQAKQFIPVTTAGDIVTDGILLRRGEDDFLLTGIPASQHWVQWHGEQNGYDVRFATNPSSAFRFDGSDPWLFRYQLQGPAALDVVERAFGSPIPRTKFFHSTPVELDGHPMRALRHGMAGQPGYEFIGDWKDADAVKEALMAAGEPLGLLHVGARAYATANVESGWIPSPTPGIYTAPELAEYRRWVPLFGIEGQRPLHGSFFSPDIEDYYSSPWEMGYGRMISFDHDFLGRDALEKTRDEVRRTKVSLVFDAADVRRALGDDADDFLLTYSRHRVDVGGQTVGVTYHTASLDPVGSLLALALVDVEHAEAGTEVSVVWGQHPGPGTAPDADLGFARIRATVAPAPFDEHARTSYRKNA